MIRVLVFLLLSSALFGQKIDLATQVKNRLPVVNGGVPSVQPMSIALGSPATADSNLVQPQLGFAVTLTKVACSTDTGTASINFQVRNEGTPNTAGSNILSASLVCSTSRATDSSLAVTALSATQLLSLQIAAVSGSPTQLRLYVFYTTP